MQNLIHYPEDIMTNFYPAIYHRAVNHLVAFGGHGGDTKIGRALCAAALRTIRARHGSEVARRERLHMLYISGQFPVKD